MTKNAKPLYEMLNEWAGIKGNSASCGSWQGGNERPYWHININDAGRGERYFPDTVKKIRAIVNRPGFGNIVTSIECPHGEVVNLYIDPNKILPENESNLEAFRSMCREVVLQLPPYEPRIYLRKYGVEEYLADGKEVPNDWAREHLANTDPDRMIIVGLQDDTIDCDSNKEFIDIILAAERKEEKASRKQVITDAINRVGKIVPLLGEYIDSQRKVAQQTTTDFASDSLKSPPPQKRDPLAPGEGASRSA